MNVKLASKGQRTIRILSTVPRFFVSDRGLCSSKEVQSVSFQSDLDEQQEEEESLRKRNKSRLSPAHRNILNNAVPYTEPKADFHDSLSYKRRMYGRYGAASGVDPSICWPTAEEFSDQREWESVAYPYTLDEMVRMNYEAKVAQDAAVRKREEDIAKKILKLDDWKRELNAKIKRKEEEALASKAKKDRLVEEVRRLFGFKVDPKDERFKELLEKKEKEERRLEKEAKKKAKEAKLLSKLTALSGEIPDSTRSQ